MTVFGVIWLGLLLCCFFIPYISPLAALTIVSSVFQCSHVALVGGAAIGPQVVTSVAFALKMFLASRKRIKIQKDAIPFQLGATLMFLTALLSTLLNGTLRNNYIRLLQLWIYTLCFLYMFRAGNFVKADFCDKLLRKLTVFLAVIGFLQLLITSRILPRFILMQELFYNDAYVDDVVYYSRDGYFRILSTYMEPSYYAPFLVGAFAYFLRRVPFSPNNSEHFLKLQLPLKIQIFEEFALYFPIAAKNSLKNRISPLGKAFAIFGTRPFSTTKSRWNETSRYFL